MYNHIYDKKRFITFIYAIVLFFICHHTLYFISMSYINRCNSIFLWVLLLILFVVCCFGAMYFIFNCIDYCLLISRYPIQYWCRTVTCYLYVYTYCFANTSFHSFSSSHIRTHTLHDHIFIVIFPPNFSYFYVWRISFYIESNATNLTFILKKVVH